MRALGFDLLRLPINWSAIEPARGTYDDAYLDARRRGGAVRGGAGIVVHDRSAPGRVLEGDRRGRRAAVGDPAAADRCCCRVRSTISATRRTSAQVTAAFETFFDRADPAGLQAAFLDDARSRRRAVGDDPAVIGFEIFNEPPVGEDARRRRSRSRPPRACSAAAPDKLVMFEPSATRNLFDFAPKSAAPFPTRERGLRAAHLHVRVLRGSDAARDAHAR